MSQHSDHAIAQALRDFAAHAGLEAPHWDGRGHLLLRAANGKLYGLEQSGEELLAHVALPLAYDPGRWQLRASRWAHYSHGHGLASGAGLQTALREINGDWYLLALTRLPPDGLDGRALLQTIEFLSNWLDSVPE